jgi:hypothetical protein
VIEDSSFTDTKNKWNTGTRIYEKRSTFTVQNSFVYAVLDSNGEVSVQACNFLRFDTAITSESTNGWSFVGRSEFTDCKTCISISVLF